jgi:hypothetical protein
MAHNNVLILEVFPYKDEHGSIHSGDIVFTVKNFKNIELVGFTTDVDLIENAMENLGRYIEMDISIDISENMKKTDEKKKPLNL